MTFVTHGKHVHGENYEVSYRQPCLKRRRKINSKKKAYKRRYIQ